MQNEKADTLKYRARVYTDKALIPRLEMMYIHRARID